MESLQARLTLRGASAVTHSQYLDAGVYTFRIIAPFNTQMVVAANDPVPGMTFFDKNDAPNVFNADLTVPRDGQYEFEFTLDRPVDAGELRIWFVPQEGPGGGGDEDDDALDGPAAPAAGWTFIYESRPNPTQEIHLSLLDGAYHGLLYQNGQHYRTWTCRHTSPTEMKCSEAQTPGLVQGLSHASDWTTLHRGVNRYVLVRKRRDRAQGGA